MKKIFLMIAAAMMATVTVNAQNDELENEIGVYYGFGSASNIVSSFTEAFIGAVGDQSSYWGPVGIEYYHHVTPVVAIGAMASIAGCKVANKDGGDNYSERFITLMPAMKFNWFRRDHFGMYSGFAVGVLFYSGDTNGDPKVQGDSKMSFMFQGTGIGFEVGSKLRGFGEIGFGERGIFCFGARYKF
ncbi:MAG: hypothetical protein IKH01_09510 [Prevotella sp.]|nr:hypothetical protein [Prevotella sp.]